MHPDTVRELDSPGFFENLETSQRSYGLISDNHENIALITLKDLGHTREDILELLRKNYYEFTSDPENYLEN